MNIKKLTLIICGFLLFGIAKAQDCEDAVVIPIDTTVCFSDVFVTHNDTIRNQLGCDSIITKYTVTRLPDVVVNPIDTTVCFSNVFITHNDTIRNQLGCDSIITKYTVTRLPDVVVNPIDTTVCFSNVFVTHNDTIRNQLGCDSIITKYTVTRLPDVVVNPIDTTVCFSDVFVTHNDTIRNQLGCDSIITKYTVNRFGPEMTQIIRKQNSTILICADTTVTANYQWGFTNKETGKESLLVDEYGNYRYFKMPHIATDEYRYFVDISYGDNGCTTRSYYEPETLRTATNSQKITVFPNPAKEHFSLSLGTAFTGKMVVSLKNLSGATLLTKQIADYKNNEVLQFDLNLPDGIYLLVVQTNENVLTSKVVIR
jgi:hypothetical protein